MYEIWVGKVGYLFIGCTCSSLEMKTNNAQYIKHKERVSKFKELFVEFLGYKSNGPMGLKGQFWI